MSRFRILPLASACALVAALAAAGCSGADFRGSTSTGGSAGSAGTGGNGTGGNGSGGASGGAGMGGTDGGAGTGGGAGSGGSAGSAGSSGSAGDGGGTCDTTKSPATESCLVSDQYAVFVDGMATTSGDGSQASPYKTIGEAVKNAGKKIIVVCDTTYDEQVMLKAGARIYGGFKCSDWSYESGQRAVVKPSAEGYALEVDSVTDPVTIEDMEFDAQDASADGGSSIAGFVHGSSKVTLRRDKLVAGKGKAGKKGVTAAYTYPTQTDLDGNSVDSVNSATVGGAGKQCNCPAGDHSTGGHGGDAAPAGDAGIVGESGGNGLPALGGGQGGTATVTTDCSQGSGKNGASATAQPDATGASSSGTLDATGWTPSNGGDGQHGGPGQGGGGGASSATSGGGGGGCGACGGAGGPGGGGGGASIALMVLDSPTVSVDAGSELVASAAGDGGTGAAGQTGQTTTGNGGIQASGACPGGAGGKGADGGAGGGGAGGISVGILWKGTTAPSVYSSVTITHGTKGAAGVGGDAGKNDGADGVAKNILQVQ